jgi:hypothetical protein
MQAKIATSAIAKVEAVGPDDPVRLLLKLNDLLLPDEEMAIIHRLGGQIICDSARIAAVIIPARCLLDVAELPGVIRVE